MLFVGRPDDRPFSAREMAAAMRGVSPAEIEAAVVELNAVYERDAAPYEIIGSAAGYRLALRDELRRMRDKLHGRIREAKLSPAAVEVLSIVAYNQPTTVEAINELRGDAERGGTGRRWCGGSWCGSIGRPIAASRRSTGRPTASSACSAWRAWPPCRGARSWKSFNAADGAVQRSHPGNRKASIRQPLTPISACPLDVRGPLPLPCIPASLPPC